MRVSKLKRFIARPTFEDEMELHRVDCMSSNGLVDNYEYLRAKQEEFGSEPQPLIPQPLASGHDLIAMGHEPGPRFRELLTAVQNLQLEGAITTREQALQWLREHAADEPDGSWQP
jgi:poly(A) polymerase